MREVHEPATFPVSAMAQAYERPLTRTAKEEWFMAKTNESGGQAQKPEAAQPAQPQPTQATPQEIRVRLDERNLRTSYANTFHVNATPEEVMIDFGLNLVSRVPGPTGQPEVMSQSNDRIILNYFLAKRLAIMLGQVVRQYEEQFGQLELDPAKRRKT